MREKSKELRTWSMVGLLCGEIHVLCVCGPVNVGNVADAGGEAEREKRMRNCESGGCGTFLRRFFALWLCGTVFVANIADAGCE